MGERISLKILLFISFRGREIERIIQNRGIQPPSILIIQTPHISAFIGPSETSPILTV